MKSEVGMFLIDGQNCFNQPGQPLYIKDGEKHMERFARSCHDHLDEITYMADTEDSHQEWHIAHPIMFRNRDGNAPKPFSKILSVDIENGLWIPQLPIKGITEYMIWYTQQLENPAQGSRRFELTIWPPHGRVGTDEWVLFSAIQKLNEAWERGAFRRVKHLTKGNEVLSEHYSGLKAEVILDGNNPLGIEDRSTFLETEIPKALKRCRKVGIAGQAISHCVRFTVEDLIELFGAEALEKLFILIDCCGPVGGYEQQTDEWLHDVGNKVNIMPIEDFWKV